MGLIDDGVGERRMSRRTVLGAAALLPLLGACGSTSTSTSSGAGPSGTAQATASGSGSVSASAPTNTTSSAATPNSLLQVDGPDVSHAAAGRPEVALTFHGQGDLGIARAVLAEARNAGAHITVMAVGEWLAAYPQIGREIVEAGHDLGNHTWSHQHINRMSAQDAYAEIKKAADAIVASVGHQGLLFRPSDTQFSSSSVRAAARRAGYHRCLSYDVDSLDYTDPGAAKVISRVTAQVAAGSIVSLHLGHQGTVQALPRIFDDLKTKNLTPVTATTLLA